jgi:secreted trypsin-like serine protease
LTSYLPSKASLLAPWIVLTAGHCIKTSEPMIVYAGIVNLNKLTEVATYQAKKVANYSFHPDFKSHKGNYYNDIGLLLLNESLKFNSRLLVTTTFQPCCLPNGLQFIM